MYNKNLLRICYDENGKVCMSDDITSTLNDAISDSDKRTTFLADAAAERVRVHATEGIYIIRLRIFSLLNFILCCLCNIF